MTIYTIYGDLTKKQVDEYLSRLTNRVFKILPLKEEGCKTIDSYVDSLVREVLGNSKVFFSEEMLAISGTLKGLDLDNHKILRSDLFKVMDLIDKSRERVK